MSRRKRGLDAPNIPSFLNKGDKATYNNMLTGSTIGGWYLLLAETLYEWDGLPASMDSRYLEKCLVTYGRAAFYNVPNIGWCNLQANPTGRYNLYGNPTAFNLKGFNGTQFANVPASDCIYIRNNAECIPTLPTIIQYAKRLAEVQRIMDVNLNQLRTPYTFKVNQEQAATIRAFWNDLEKNEPLMIFNDEIQADMGVIKMPHEYFLDKLASYKRQLQSDLLTFLGIDNINFEKAAQMVDREVSANRELIERFLECGLTYRQQAAEELNAATNFKVSVRPRQFQKVLIVATDEVGNTREYNVYAEVDRSGAIYNDATTADPNL